MVRSDGGGDTGDERRWHLQVGQIMKALSRRAEAGGVAQLLCSGKSGVLVNASISLLAFRWHFDMSIVRIPGERGKKKSIRDVQKKRFFFLPSQAFEIIKNVGHCKKENKRICHFLKKCRINTALFHLTPLPAHLPPLLWCKKQK